MKNKNIEDFNRIVPGQNDEPRDIRPSLNQFGDFEEILGIDTVIENLRRMLLTPRGTYPFDPEFGSDIYKFIFEPADLVTKEEIEYEVSSLISYLRYPKTKITYKVIFFNDSKGFRLDFDIKYNGEHKKSTVVLDETLLTTLEV